MVPCSRPPLTSGTAQVVRQQLLWHACTDRAPCLRALPTVKAFRPDMLVRTREIIEQEANLQFGLARPCNDRASLTLGRHASLAKVRADRDPRA